MQSHDLKIEPKYFDAVWSGKKPFEIRKNDRDFKEGDQVTLREYDRNASVPSEAFKYTGRTFIAKIGYLTAFQQRKGYVVFALLPLRLLTPC